MDTYSGELADQLREYKEESVEGKPNRPNKQRKVGVRLMTALQVLQGGYYEIRATPTLFENDMCLTERADRRMSSRFFLPCPTSA